MWANHYKTVLESRQEKIVAQTKVVMEMREKWLEGAFDKTW